MSALQPWLLFMPDGSYDGLIWSPESEDEAGRKLFGRKSSWESMKKKGWTIRRGVDDEHLQLTADLVKARAEKAVPNV